MQKGADAAAADDEDILLLLLPFFGRKGVDRAFGTKAPRAKKGEGDCEKEERERTEYVARPQRRF